MQILVCKLITGTIKRFYAYLFSEVSFAYHSDLFVQVILNCFIHCCWLDFIAKLTKTILRDLYLL